jgi:hypothetical protein
MKYLLAFLAGAGAGAVGTYLYFRNRIDTIVKDTVNEEMERFFTRQEQMMSAPEVEEVTPDEEEEKEIVTDVPDTTEKTSIVKMEEIVRTNYRDNGIEEDEDFDDEDEISDEEIAEMIGGQRKRMEEGTRYITEEEHDTTCIGYDHSEFTYYPDGNILTDVHDNAVEFPEV